jgi:AraC family transcriptional regulator
MIERRTGGGRDGGSRDATLRQHTVRIARAVRQVLAHLDGDHTLASLAAHAALSPFHFLRVFRALARETPDAFVRRLRLQRAAWQLVTGDATVLAVALAARFDSPEGFTRAFRRLYGATPQVFRRVRGDPWAPFASPIADYRPDAPFAPPREDAAMTFELRPLPAMLFAAVRIVGPYNAVGPAFQRIVGWAMQAGVMTPATKVLGMSYDDPAKVPAGQLRYDAAVTLARPVATPPDIRIAVLPASTWAMAQHKGSYAAMPQTFAGIFQALRARPDLVPVWLPCLEIYLNSPADTATEDLRTDVGIPVAAWP